jgi:hypothetical protein
VEEDGALIGHIVPEEIDECVVQNNDLLLHHGF